MLLFFLLSIFAFSSEHYASNKIISTNISGLGNYVCATRTLLYNEQVPQVRKYRLCCCSLKDVCHVLPRLS